MGFLKGVCEVEADGFESEVIFGYGSIFKEFKKEGVAFLPVKCCSCFIEF